MKIKKMIEADFDHTNDQLWTAIGIFVVSKNEIFTMYDLGGNEKS